MFHRHKDTPKPLIVSPRVKTVRLLQGHEELQAAVERSRNFEREESMSTSDESAPTTAS